MSCPKCKSEDVVIRTSTTSTVSKTYGFWWRKVAREEKTETCHRCLDCGAEWEGEREMSANKCPCCGDTISIFPDSGFYECDSCPFMCALEDLPRIAAAMKAEARHAALVEAVAWEKETALHWEFGRIKRFIAEREALESMFSSRSEVNRLIAEREG